jgi:hypothetical protein
VNVRISGGSLTAQNTVAARLAQVVRHHLGHIEQRRHPIRASRVHSLLMQIQFHASRSARFQYSNQVNQRTAQAVDAAHQHFLHGTRPDSID